MLYSTMMQSGRWPAASDFERDDDSGVPRDSGCHWWLATSVRGESALVGEPPVAPDPPNEALESREDSTTRADPVSFRRPTGPGGSSIRPINRPPADDRP